MLDKEVDSPSFNVFNAYKALIAVNRVSNLAIS